MISDYTENRIEKAPPEAATRPELHGSKGRIEERRHCRLTEARLWKRREEMRGRESQNPKWFKKTKRLEKITLTAKDRGYFCLFMIKRVFFTFLLSSLLGLFSPQSYRHTQCYGHNTNPLRNGILHSAWPPPRKDIMAAATTAIDYRDKAIQLIKTHWTVFTKPVQHKNDLNILDWWHTIVSFVNGKKISRTSLVANTLIVANTKMKNASWRLA
jgi:hypothetical protein